VTRITVALPLLAALVASRALAQQADSVPRLHGLRFANDTLAFAPPASLREGGLLVRPRPAAAAVARRWAASVRARLAARQAARWRYPVAGGDSTELFGVGPAAATEFVAAPEAPPPAAAPPPTILQRYADLGLALNARFELRWDRQKNLRCQPSEAGLLSSGCSSAIAPPRLDPQFNVRTGGVVGQRVHLDVDYDSQREFDASNNIRVFYQGLEDEILRRVEVGNVTFSAPASRFITGGIPANNFGFQAEGQLGPVDFSGIYAQQRGNVVRGRTFVVGQQTLQTVDRQVNDRDYEPNRFFFVVDPATLPGYPAVDILNLNRAGLPPASQVVQVRVYRRRSTVGQTTAQQNYGGIPAVATRPDSPQRAGPFPWDLLIEGRDYYLDPSGLWFALTNQLEQGDYLAVSYITAAGDTVGTFPAVAQPNHTDTLRLIHEPQSGPDVPTFRYALRNVYRVGGISGTVRDGMQLRILVSQSERPAAGAATFLALLGLALPTDQTQFDQVNRLFPRERDPGNGSPLRDYFIVFPSLMPFADSTLLAPEFRNDSLYRTPTYLLQSQGPTPLYQLALHYQATGGDERGTLSLGAAQIRPGSERLTVGNETLVRNVDYTINYEIGQVTFLHPDTLFSQPTPVTVQYEEQPGFAVAPTSIYGLQTRYDLGVHGSVSLLGLLQQQHTNFTRPPLGFEPSSNFVGGVSGNFRFEPQGLTRLLNALPLVHTEVPSLVTLDAELATSRPSPNQIGTAWVETFEGEGGTFLPLAESSWQLGSRPASTHGLDPSSGIDLAAGFQDADAASLVWQNLIATSNGSVVQYTAPEIDPSIREQGTGQTFETVLWMYMHPDTVGGLPDPRTYQPRWVLPHTPGPRWRSITLPLSATGVDLSRVEYLEFWVFEDAQRSARDAGTTLLFDFGKVYEDAVDFVPTSFQVTAQGDTIYSGRRRIGEGRLDTERDTLTNAWNAINNDNGILGAVADSIFDENTGQYVHDMPLCTSDLATRLTAYPWGDPQARCTRHNGTPDTEDLDGDGHLDSLVAAPSESYFRYVFPLGDSTYFVRGGGPVDASGNVDSSSGRWRLYRIPFRADTFQVGSPDIRQVRSLRLTVVVPERAGAEPPIRFGLARVELVGAPWVKRSATPIPGIAGNLGAAHGEVIASVISTENRADLGYTPPPGVTDQGATQSGGFQVGPTQINERSLRLIGRDVQVGERAEAYYQFPEGQRNFLGYRQLRVWARGRGNGWDNDQLSFFIKVGQDQNNFYMFRAHVQTTTWLPDLVVDFAEWQALRSQIEQRFLSGQPPSGAAECGGDTLAYVACDSTRTYIVHVRDPGVAPPNLAQVREMAVGFERDSGVAADTAELWVDDIRLSQVVKNAGYAGAVNLHVVAADVADLNVMMSRRDAQFRQLGEDPSYVTDNQFALTTTVHLERLGLDRLGLTAPFAVRLNRSSDDPYFLSGTDVLAAPLVGLRRPQTTQTSYSLALRRSRRGSRWWQRYLVDNLSLTSLFSSGVSTSQLSQSNTQLTSVAMSYQAQPTERSFRYVPGFLARFLRSLPLIGKAAFVQGLDQARLRWTPVTVQFSSTYGGSRAVLQTFRVPIETVSDTLATTARSLQASLRDQASVELRPFQSTSLGAVYSSTRDLKNYGDSSTIGVLTRESSSRLAGVGLGFESARTLGVHLSYSPNLVSWLRPRLTVSTNFALLRDPNGGAAERTQGDTAGGYRLPTTFTNGRVTELGGTLDLARAVRSLLGDSSVVARWFGRIAAIDFSTRSDLRSQFYRTGFDPSLGYQLGLGGVDAFRAINGRPAVSASHHAQTRLSSALRLPLGLSVSAAYGHGLQQTWSARGDAQAELDQTSTTWPDLTGRWAWSPRGFVGHIVSNLSASAGWRVVTSENAQPPLASGLGGPAEATGGVSSGQEARSWPLSLAVTWAPRMSSSLSYSPSRSSSRSAGSVTQTDNNSLSASLSFSFRPPQEVVPLKSDIRTSLRYASSDNRGCIVLVGSTDCTSIFDSGRQSYNLSMDTDMPPNVSAGIAVGYTLTSDAVLNRKFSQFSLTVSVTVNLQAGQPR
jgi:hypothetical protein